MGAPVEGCARQRQHAETSWHGHCSLPRTRTVVDPPQYRSTEEVSKACSIERGYSRGTRSREGVSAQARQRSGKLVETRGTMYSMNGRPTGPLIVFSDSVSAVEMESWFAELKRILVGAPEGFGLIIDLRKLESLPKNTTKIVDEALEYCERLGLCRTAVILDGSSKSASGQLDAQRIFESVRNRIVDAAAHPNWTDIAIRWVRDGREPTQNSIRAGQCPEHESWSHTKVWVRESG